MQSSESSICVNVTSHFASVICFCIAAWFLLLMIMLQQQQLQATHHARFFDFNRAAAKLRKLNVGKTGTSGLDLATLNNGG